jgi:hypothetical protein
LNAPPHGVLTSAHALQQKRAIQLMIEWRRVVRATIASNLYELRLPANAHYGYGARHCCSDANTRYSFRRAIAAPKNTGYGSAHICGIDKIGKTLKASRWPLGSTA